MLTRPTRRGRAALDRFRAWRRAFPRTLASAALALLAAAASTLPTSVAHAASDAFYSPTITVNPACGAASDNVFEFIDDNGNPSAWTYANGSQWCVRGDWYFPPLPANQHCEIYFYVPNGNATAALPVGLFESDGNPNIGSLLIHEDLHDTYYKFFDKPSGFDVPVNHLNFGDNNGQSYPSQIGWGETNSVEVKCS
jgi:hypothetical protein